MSLIRSDAPTVDQSLMMYEQKHMVTAAWGHHLSLFRNSGKIRLAYCFVKRDLTIARLPRFMSITTHKRT